MGLMRFVVPRRDLLPPGAVSAASFAGRDDIPWQAKITATGAGIDVDRFEADSGRLNIPWQVEGHGDLMLSTATLLERERPYNLPLELARGTLNRLRSQVASFEAAGSRISRDIDAKSREALAHFARAVTSQHDPFLTADRAQASIVAAVDAIAIFSRRVSELTIALRRQQAQRSVPLLGANIGRWRPRGKIASVLSAAFNTIAVPLAWRNVEGVEGKLDWSRYDAQFAWCQSAGLRVCAGPLMHVDSHALPDWLYLWESDFDSLVRLMSDYITAAVNRYKGRVHLWHASAGLNTATALPLADEQRLRLTVRALEATKAADPRTPVIITFSAPWGEYLSKRDTDLSPLQFADTLSRADLGIAGFGLELDPSDQSVSGWFRDELEVGRMIDRWSQIGLPLVIWLKIPSKSARWPDKDLQTMWLERYLPTLLAKPLVHGIFWSQFKDSTNTSRPPIGLFDSAGAAKPIVSALPGLRQKYLT